MLVNTKDGACRSCGGQLEITDFDDATMTVLCTAPGCGDSYPVETDAFGDGSVTYYFALISETRKQKGGSMNALTDHELATVLAALRQWQMDREANPEDLADSVHFENHKPLTSTEIDDLCERLNCDEGRTP